MPNYIAKWCVFVEAENPEDAAVKAAAWAESPDNSTWQIVDTDTGEPTVVDLNAREVIECRL